MCFFINWSGYMYMLFIAVAVRYYEPIVDEPNVLVVLMELYMMRTCIQANKLSAGVFSSSQPVCGTSCPRYKAH